MKNEVDEAIKQIHRTNRTKNDVFVVLCSLNLLNAAVKIDEYKDLVGYGLIKPSVSKLIQTCLANSSENLVDEIFYNAENQCVYIRCFGIQFSFHNIDTKRISPSILSSISNETIKWDGVRLQPIALELYFLSKECLKEGLHDTNIIKERFLNILV